MSVMNQSSRYGGISQLLHWTTALLVFVLLVLGKMGLMDAEHPDSAGFIWHGSLGVLVLALVIARLIWRWVSPPPDLPATMTRLGRIAARTMHVSFYVMLIALPLSGWLAVSSEGSRVNFFNVASLPRWERSAPTVARPVAVARAPAVPETAGEEDENLSKELHELLADALLILVALHFLAALKHEFINRDGLIRRMLPATARTKSAEA